MKTKEERKAFFLGICSTLLVVGTVLPATAALVTKKIDVYANSIKVYVDDVKIEPKDVNGKAVDIYVHDGTTYLPIRAIANALHIPVLYDSSTQSAYLGKHLEQQPTTPEIPPPTSSHKLLEVCPPYQMDFFEKLDSVNMAGKTYTNALHAVPILTSQEDKIDKRRVYFNLKGQYNTVQFDFGHIDGRENENGMLNIYLDGKLSYSLEGTSNMVPKHYELDVTGVSQMEIHGGNGMTHYAISNCEIF